MPIDETAKTQSGAIQSVVLALKVLDQVSQTQDLGVSELARKLDMPKSSLQRYLTTLGSTGWLEPSEESPTRWRLGNSAVSLGLRAADSMDLRKVALPVLQKLRDLTGETVLLSIPHQLGALVIERVDSLKSLRTFTSLGEHMPYHASAAGLSMLAWYPEGRVDEILEAEATTFVTRVGDDREEIGAELAQIRERGYAINSGRWTDGISGLGAAVKDANAEVVASISVAVPSVRFEQRKYREVGEYLASLVADIAPLIR